jgi:hypothetical protein
MRSKSSSRLSSTSIRWGNNFFRLLSHHVGDSIPSWDALLPLQQELFPLAGSQYLWPNRFERQAATRNCAQGPGPILPEPKVTVRSYVAMGKRALSDEQLLPEPKLPVGSYVAMGKRALSDEHECNESANENNESATESQTQGWPPPGSLKPPSGKGDRLLGFLISDFLCAVSDGTKEPPASFHR